MLNTIYWRFTISAIIPLYSIFILQSSSPNPTKYQLDVISAKLLQSDHTVWIIKSPRLLAQNKQAASNFTGVASHHFT